MDQIMHISLMEMAGKRPRAQTAPIVEHCSPGLNTHGISLLMQLFYPAELIGHLLNIIAEIRKALHQMQVAAQTDPVDGRPQ